MVRRGGSFSFKCTDLQNPIGRTEKFEDDAQKADEFTDLMPCRHVVSYMSGAIWWSKLFQMTIFSSTFINVSSSNFFVWKYFCLKLFGGQRSRSLDAFSGQKLFETPSELGDIAISNCVLPYMVAPAGKG